MKNVKKTLTSVVLAFQVLSLTAGAATINTVQLAERNVTVKGTSEEATVTYKVHSKDTSGNSISEICEMGEASVIDGEFLIHVKMPEFFNGEETDGEYVVTVMGEESDTEEFLYIAYSSLTEFVDDIKDIDDGKELVTLFAATSDGGYPNLIILENLGADMEYYKGLDEKDQENLADAFIAEMGEEKLTTRNFSSVFEKAKTIQYINKNGISAEWLDESGFEFDGVSFGEIEDENLKEYIFEAIKDIKNFESYRDLEKRYREANVVYIINDAKYTEYDDIVAKYDDIIEITKEDYYEDYKDMKSSEQKKVNSKVKNEITDKAISGVEDFRDFYEDAVEEVQKESKKNSSSGGGGGGGSKSSGSGMSFVVPEVSNPTKEQKTEETLSEFTDLDDVEWAKNAIKGLAKYGVVAGYDDKTFRPNKKITREEFIKMIVAAKGFSLNESACGFLDVDQNGWYAPYVNAAYKAGIIAGVSESEFGVGREITREEMAVIIVRIKSFDGANETYEAFADDADIAPYAKDAVYGLYKAGKVSGVGNNMFGPKQIVNRAQAAKIIYDVLFAGI